MTIGIINVSSRGQIVIPEQIRKNLGIKEGSRLLVIEKNNTLILTKDTDVIDKLEEQDKKEEGGWLALAEQSLASIWNSKKDQKAWGRYLND